MKTTLNLSRYICSSIESFAKQGEVQGPGIGVGVVKDVGIIGGSSSSSSLVLQNVHKPIHYMYPNIECPNIFTLVMFVQAQ